MLSIEEIKKEGLLAVGASCLSIGVPMLMTVVQSHDPYAAAIGGLFFVSGVACIAGRAVVKRKATYPPILEKKEDN